MEEIQVNGVLLHYIRVGRGRPVVLVHGNGEDHRLFDCEVGQLAAAGYTVYAPDSRGHGANEPLNEYHYADMAEDIYQFIKTLGLEKPAYYGHSDGGIIGLLLEISHPGTLGLLAVSGTNLSPEGLTPEFLEDCRQAEERSSSPLTRLILTEPDISPEQLKSIRIPVLVTVGEYDLILPSETARIAAALPLSTLQTVKGADHGSYVSGSEVMGNLLIHFLKEHKYL